MEHSTGSNKPLIVSPEEHQAEQQLRRVEQRDGYTVRTGPNVKSSHVPAGFFIVDGREEANSERCCHCGGHFQIVAGSGIRRGFCTRCMGPTCGKQKCDPCMPFEKRLELYERGKLKTL